MAKGKLKPINDSHFRVKAHNDLQSGATLLSLWLEIPDHCQLQCNYCFANTVRNHPHLAEANLKLGEYLDLLEDFQKNGGHYLGLPGLGEPFHPLNRELSLAIVRRATELGLKTTVFTTGEALFWEMDPGRAYAEIISAEPDFAYANEFLKNDVILLVKFNSSDGDVQDRLVCQPGYTVARNKAMEWLISRYRINQANRLGIVTSIMPENEGEISDLFRFAAENRLIFDCDTILPRGRGKSFLDRHSVHRMSPQEYRAIYQELDKLSPDKLAAGGSYVGQSCDRVKHHLYVDVKGDVYPCIGCVGREESLVLGNVRRQNLREIWESPKRSRLRDDFCSLVLGVCSYCENFDRSCLSCLGRSVEQFEFHEATSLIHTKGCFNHKPDWIRWTTQCVQYVRSRISSAPLEARQTIRREIEKYGPELFWRSLPEKVFHGRPVQAFPALRKDLTYTDLNFPTREVWDLIDFGHPVGPEQIRAEIDSLLPRILLPSLKIISEDFDNSFSPSEVGLEKSKPGLIQFSNLMFYLPHKKRFFYRTLAQNSLDNRVLSRPEHRRFREQHPSTLKAINRELELRNRKIRLWQRWAETFEDNRSAADLLVPHIVDLSQEMENERIDTYELILGQTLSEQEGVSIHNGIWLNDERILSVHPVLDMKSVHDRLQRAHDFVHQVVSHDSDWSRYEETLSECVFAYSDPDRFGELKTLYTEMARNAFFPTNPADLPLDEVKALEQEVQQAIRESLVANLICPILGEEKNRLFQETLRLRIKQAPWPDLCRAIREVQESRKKNQPIIPSLFEGIPLSGAPGFMKRLFNPLLLHFFYLFACDRGKQRGMSKYWLKALNYFIWLCFLRDHGGIKSYYVHHAPNLRLHLDVLIEEEIIHSTPSGLIVGASGRLPREARSAYSFLFDYVMNPFEELIQTEFITTENSKHIRRYYETVALMKAKEEAIVHYGHTVGHRLSPILAYIEGVDISRERAQANALFLNDLSVVLQANTLGTAKDLYTHTKKKRFLEYEDTEKEFDIVQLILKRWRYLAESHQPVLITGEENIQNIMILIDFSGPLKVATIGFMLKDTVNGMKCRPKEAFYSQLFSELLLNTVRYGYIPKNLFDLERKSGRVSVALDSQVIREHNSAIAPPGCHAIVISNRVGNKPPPVWLSQESWTLWPADRENDGPGMAIAILRRLKLGELWYRYNPEKNVFRVAVWLDGLRFPDKEGVNE